MARPIKWRQIDKLPTTKHFVASEEISDDIPKNILKLEEFEAIRLKDTLGLEQDECAQRMQVSRSTFRRILVEARKKIADSLVNGKSITLEGGNYTQNICSLYCSKCGYSWNESYERVKDEISCPKCGSVNTNCTGETRGCGRCRRRGWK